MLRRNGEEGGRQGGGEEREEGDQWGPLALNP